MSEAMALGAPWGPSRNAGVILARKLGAVQRPSRTYRAGRICATGGCDTLPSIYNPDARCSIHEPAQLGNVPDAGRAA